jgi:hypothetical protein
MVDLSLLLKLTFTMKTFFKAVAVIFAILFIWSATLQSNDPDAFKWYLIYGMGALASILFIIEKLRFVWTLVLFIYYLGFAISNWPVKFEGFSIGEGDIVNIEKAREVGGLLILGFVMLLYGTRIWYTKRL